MKRFGRDIAGYGLIIIAFPVGLLPGPGGIPLIIAGLGLLAQHNPWAKKLLQYVDRHSKSFRILLFPERKNIQRLWDGITILLFIGAMIVGIYSGGWIQRILPTSLACMALVLFLSNRSRIEALQRKIKR